MLRLNISGITIITVKYADYHCIIHNISKSEAINLLKNSVLKDREHRQSKKYFHKFQWIQSSFFLIFKSLNINIGAVMKNPEMIKLVPDYLKTKKFLKDYAVKKLPYLFRYLVYVPDRCKPQQMCHKAILENGGTLKSVPDY